MFTVIAANAGEPSFQIAAIEELVHHLRDDGAQIAVPGLVALLVEIENVSKLDKRSRELVHSET